METIFFLIGKLREYIKNSWKMTHESTHEVNKYCQKASKKENMMENTNHPNKTKPYTP